MYERQQCCSVSTVLSRCKQGSFGFCNGLTSPSPINSVCQSDRTGNGLPVPGLKQPCLRCKRWPVADSKVGAAATKEAPTRTAKIACRGAMVMVIVVRNVVDDVLLREWTGCSVCFKRTTEGREARLPFIPRHLLSICLMSILLDSFQEKSVIIRSSTRVLHQQEGYSKDAIGQRACMPSNPIVEFDRHSKLKSRITHGCMHTFRFG